MSTPTTCHTALMELPNLKPVNLVSVPVGGLDTIETLIDYETPKFIAELNDLVNEQTKRILEVRYSDPVKRYVALGFETKYHVSTLKVYSAILKKLVEERNNLVSVGHEVTNYQNRIANVGVGIKILSIRLNKMVSRISDELPTEFGEIHRLETTYDTLKAEHLELGGDPDVLAEMDASLSG